MDPILAADALTAAPSPLTTRETEVLRTARGDRLVRDIARKLFLSPGTVRNHLATIRQKLGADSRADAYRIVQEYSWLQTALLFEQTCLREDQIPCHASHPVQPATTHRR